MTADPIDYLAPDVPPALPWHEVPLVRATAETLEGYGALVDDPENFPVEIVTWPASGWRPIDSGTGNEAGTVTGTFAFRWEGDFLFGQNHAVDDRYLLGWSTNPGEAQRGPVPETAPERVLLWHANYHPDGGQLFFPKNGEAFIAPLALPGDDVTPADFVAFYVEDGKGLYIHPNIWHEAVFPLAPQASFHDEQGRIHGRVSVHFPREFGVFLAVALRRV